MHEFSIEILAPAWHEIEEIADMHLSLVGPASAKKTTDKILNHIELLKDNPFIGTECEEKILRTDHYRKLFIGKYLCFYRIIGKTIYVYHVIDGKRNYPILFEINQGSTD